MRLWSELKSNKPATRKIKRKNIFCLVGLFLLVKKIKSEEMGELLAEKARVAEEEAILLGKKASDAEEEIKRLRLCLSKV